MRTACARPRPLISAAPPSSTWQMHGRAWACPLPDAPMGQGGAQGLGLPARPRPRRPDDPGARPRLPAEGRAREAGAVGTAGRAGGCSKAHLAAARHRHPLADRRRPLAHQRAATYLGCAVGSRAAQVHRTGGLCQRPLQRGRIVQRRCAQPQQARAAGGGGDRRNDSGAGGRRPHRRRGNGIYGRRPA